ncbi:MAG: zinc ribbon domain-containing protein [Nostocaceae cyanobacterium]|nr:zinc ribbon domain-containing protein [Nostocaceae cyanobacterium]
MKQSKASLMKRTCRVYLNDLNHGKKQVLKQFLLKCHEVMQYYVDLFWSRQDFSGKLADLPTVHRSKNRFGITTRLGQALAKQAKEILRSQHKKPKSQQRKPQLRQFTCTLFYHFVKIEKYKNSHFDWAICLIGSGAPKLVIPIHSTKLINRRLEQGWHLSKTIRMGLRGGQLWIDLIFEKSRPKLKSDGRFLGMDSNYKNGLVFSDAQNVGTELYPKIQGFAKRQKNTKAEIKSMLGKAIKQIDFSQVKVLVIENLKKVKHGKRGTFSRVFNRRLSHWLYAYAVSLLSRRCEELGIEVQRKDPYKTSQFCRICGKWDRRNRRGDRFLCVNCGHVDHADHNASKNLEFLGLAGVYGLRSLSSSRLCSKKQSFP